MTDRMNNQRAANQYWRDDNESNQNRGLAQSEPTRYDYGMSRSGGAYSPFELMRRFSEDVDRIFNSLGFGSFGNFSNFGWPGEQSQQLSQFGGTGTSGWSPNVDVVTRGDDLLVLADLPGIKPEDVQIETDDNSLIIRGETKKQNERNDRGYFYSERSFGSFFRRIPLPPDVNAENATAQVNNGVLEITLPGAVKQIQPQRRRIQIQGAGTSTSQQTGQTQSNQNASSGTGQSFAGTQGNTPTGNQESNG